MGGKSSGFPPFPLTLISFIFLLPTFDPIRCIVIVLGVQNGAFEKNPTELPITIGELLDIDDSDYFKFNGNDGSILLGQYHSSQHSNAHEHSQMMITITKIFDIKIVSSYHSLHI